MPLRSALLNTYRALEHTIVPDLRNAHCVYGDVLGSHVPGADWLDVGCGHHVLRLWQEEQEAGLVSRCHKVVGMDGDFASLQKHRSIHDRVLGAIDQIPFRDESFDLVTANMVVEHLDAPTIQFCEICRVLKPGGLFIFHTPNKNGYSTLLARAIPERAKKGLVNLLEKERAAGDVFQTFYKVNTEQAVRQFAEFAGFEVQELRMVATGANLIIFPPLVICELALIRLLMAKPFKTLRTNMIVVLRKRNKLFIERTRRRSTEACQQVSQWEKKNLSVPVR